MLALYEQLVSEKEIERDEVQLQVLQKLQKLLVQMKNYRPPPIHPPNPQVSSINSEGSILRNMFSKFMKNEESVPKSGNGNHNGNGNGNGQVAIFTHAPKGVYLCGSPG